MRFAFLSTLHTMARLSDPSARVRAFRKQHESRWIDVAWQRLLRFSGGRSTRTSKLSVASARRKRSAPTSTEEQARDLVH
jgi:hypothetical protein